MSEFDETTKTLNFDAPNSYVGRSVTRPNARRLAQGRGQYVDDIVLPRMVHVAYVRSPYAHAKVVRIESKKAAAMPGVVRVVTGAEIAMVCKPYVGVLTHLAGMRSPPQYPLAMDVARWQGEPVVAVVAQSRACSGAGAVLGERGHGHEQRCEDELLHRGTPLRLGQGAAR